MRRSKAAYLNYVCPKCFNQLQNCTCKSFPPWDLLYIDQRIQPHVRILNEKGYVTFTSCEGHYLGKPGVTSHVGFARDYDIFSDLPEGFTYNKSKRMLWCFYDAKLNRDQFDAERAFNLAKLLQWCQDLPDNG